MSPSRTSRSRDKQSRCLVLFTKPAQPGRVKTRMMPELTARQAAELHQAFLDDLVPRLLSGSFELAIAWAVEPGEVLPETAAVSFRQHGDDLGQRLYDGLERAARQYRFVAAVGGDHPEIPLERIEEAFEVLARGEDLVLGPAADGGYYLIGADREALDGHLFAQIPWSTPAVFEETRRRCRELGIEPYLLPSGHDVDSPSDLERLTRRIASGATGCPHVADLLRSWGRLA